jgi:hypothetical protein
MRSQGSIVPHVVWIVTRPPRLVTAMLPSVPVVICGENPATGEAPAWPAGRKLITLAIFVWIAEICVRPTAVLAVFWAMVPAARREWC